ncbi:HAD family phosphatase [Candidatus Saccharibacteria bacterium]|nr:HAD family phosphatase [Candidatus Saccharibacteria bacterium]
MIKAVIFDLYGVLGLNGWQSFKAEHFANQPEAWDQVREIGKRVDEGRANQQEFVAAVAEATGYDETMIRAQFEDTKPNKPLLEFIAAKLAGSYKIGLLSNTSRDVFSTVFSPEELGLFDAVLSSFHVGLVKPDPAMFTLMCEKLHIAPDEAIMVDDKAKHVAAAQKLGMQTVQYDSAEQAIAAIERLLAA